MSTDLLSIPSLVESPFIIVKIGKYTFGSYADSRTLNRNGGTLNVTYPNFMDSINIVKVNGTVNQYQLKMIYTVQAGSDPNLLDKVFSTISNDRKITLSYGDWAAPSYIYKEEVAIVTKITSNVDFNASKITYNLNCTSTSLPLTASKHNFPKRVAKGSDVIKEMLFNKKYGMTDVFYGMANKSDVLLKNIIASDDKEIVLEAKKSTSPLDYLNYVVSCMQPVDSPGSSKSLCKSKYMITAIDDTKGELGGPYFKINKVSSRVSTSNSLNTFQIDIGYPGDNFVTNFTIKDDQSWSILYNYANDVDIPSYSYKINDAGTLVATDSPTMLTSATLRRQTSALKSWWSDMTQFPISATLTIKGLLRPAVLMSYVKINALFYGQRHVSSGLYVINKQEDSLNSSGYKTTLSLIRVGADDEL